MKSNKKALIVEGGGQRGVFSFGITDTFIKKNFDPFDLYIGVSNGVAVLCWFLIRETDNNIEKLLYASRGNYICLLYTSPSPRDRQKSRMPSSA